MEGQVINGGGAVPNYTEPTTVAGTPGKAGVQPQTADKSALNPIQDVLTSLNAGAAEAVKVVNNGRQTAVTPGGDPSKPILSNPPVSASTTTVKSNPFLGGVNYLAQITMAVQDMEKMKRAAALLMALGGAQIMNLMMQAQIEKGAAQKADFYAQAKQQLFTMVAAIASIAITGLGVVGGLAAGGIGAGKALKGGGAKTSVTSDAPDAAPAPASGSRPNAKSTSVSFAPETTGGAKPPAPTASSGMKSAAADAAPDAPSPTSQPHVTPGSTQAKSGTPGAPDDAPSPSKGMADAAEGKSGKGEIADGDDVPQHWSKGFAEGWQAATPVTNMMTQVGGQAGQVMESAAAIGILHERGQLAQEIAILDGTIELMKQLMQTLLNGEATLLQENAEAQALLSKIWDQVPQINGSLTGH